MYNTITWQLPLMSSILSLCASECIWYFFLLHVWPHQFSCMLFNTQWPKYARLITICSVSDCNYWCILRCLSAQLLLPHAAKQPSIGTVQKNQMYLVISFNVNLLPAKQNNLMNRKQKLWFYCLWKLNLTPKFPILVFIPLSEKNTHSLLAPLSLKASARLPVG